MKFQPKSATELASANLFPKGEYPAQVIEATDTVSKKSGNEMIKLVVKVWNGDRAQNINAYLMDAMPAQLRHFCEATGMLAKYEAGTLAADDCVGKSLTVKLKIEEDKSGQYDPKNSIADFVVDKEKRPAGYAPKKRRAADEDSDSDIPF